MAEQAKRLRCLARVMKRDTYRVDRSNSNRQFSLHYDEAQCSRRAVDDGLCAQHSKMRAWAILYRDPDVYIEKGED